MRDEGADRLVAKGRRGRSRILWREGVIWVGLATSTAIPPEVVMTYLREIRVENAYEALVVEQALAMARDLKRTAAAAPDGRVLAIAEQAAVRQGRELTRKSLEAVLNAQGADLEKKLRRTASAPAAASDGIAAAARDRCSPPADR